MDVQCVACDHTVPEFSLLSDQFFNITYNVKDGILTLKRLWLNVGINPSINIYNV